MSDHKGSASTPRDELGELTPIEVHIITELRELNKQGQDELLNHLRIMRECGVFRKGTFSLEWARMLQDNPYGPSRGLSQAPRSTRRTHNPEGGITP